MALNLAQKYVCGNAITPYSSLTRRLLTPLSSSLSISCPIFVWISKFFIEVFLFSLSKKSSYFVDTLFSWLRFYNQVFNSRRPFLFVAQHAISIPASLSATPPSRPPSSTIPTFTGWSESGRLGRNWWWGWYKAGLLNGTASTPFISLRAPILCYP